MCASSSFSLAVLCRARVVFTRISVVVLLSCSLLAMNRVAIPWHGTIFLLSQHLGTHIKGISTVCRCYSAMNILYPLFCLSSFVSYSHNSSLALYVRFFSCRWLFFRFFSLRYSFTSSFLLNVSWFIVISLEPLLLLLLLIHTHFFLHSARVSVCVYGVYRCCCYFDVLHRFTCRK